MRRTTFNRTTRGRCGYGKMELLVALGVIAVLLSLVVPAINTSQGGSSHRTHCLNNMKNLGLAMHSYATANRGQLPGYSTWSEDGEPRHSWVIDILPYIDQNGVADRWGHSARWDARTNADDSMHDNAALADMALKVLRCPSHPNEKNALSYVVNAGFANRRISSNVHDFDRLNIDWNQDGTVDDADHAIAKDSGTFWRTIGKESGSLSLQDFYDGAGNTIMLSESLHAGSQTWAGPAADSCAFTFAIAPNPASIGSARPDPRENVTINGHGSTSKRRPMLSSNHPGQVNIVTAEGAARALSEDIDPDVLRRLITPRGTLHDEEPIAGGDSF